jgi:hypothetical protein
MGSCTVDDYVFLRYLANDLHGRELTEFVSHLRTCEACGQRLAEERALSALMKRSRPLYAASPALRTRVARLFVEFAEPSRRAPLPMMRTWRFLWRPLSYPKKVTPAIERLGESLSEPGEKLPRCACLRRLRVVFWWR